MRRTAHVLGLAAAALAAPAASPEAPPPADLYPGRVHEIPVPGGPRHLVLADFDGDRLPDALVATDAGDAALLAAKGDGALGEPVAIPLGGGAPVGLAAGDFDGDGAADAALLDAGGSLRLLRGDGRGGLAAAPPAAAGAAPAALAAGDLDGDGRTDLAVADPASGAVHLFCVDAGGNPAPAGAVDTGGAPDSLAIADLDGDGRLDLLVGDRAGNVVRVLFRGRDGSFVPGPVLPSPYPGPVAAGDLNLDGRTDIVVLDGIPPGEEVFPGPLYVRACLGRGGGRFARDLTESAPGEGAFTTAVADLDGDARADILVGCAAEGVLTAFPSGGDGWFHERHVFRLGGAGGPASVAAADLDGDGRPEVVGTWPGAGILRVLRPPADWARPSGSRVWLLHEAEALAAADFSGDGLPDLLALDLFHGYLSLLVGTAGGLPVPVYGDSISGTAGLPATGDFDGDGRPDFALGVDRRVGALLGVGFTKTDGALDRSFGLEVGDGPAATAAADFDGDGRLDLATANWEADSVSVVLGAGDGSFPVRRDSPAGDGPVSIAAADLDGDGNVDLALGYWIAQTVGVLLGRGDGTFARGAEVPCGRDPRSILLADLDRDGAPDLAAVAPRDDRVLTFRGRGDGTFEEAGAHPVGAVPWTVAFADLDGDGLGDLATADRSGGTVSVLRGLPGGDLAAAEAYATERPYPWSLAAADFDGDGRTDLAVGHLDEDGLTFLRPGALPGSATRARVVSAGVSPPLVLPGSSCTIRVRWDRPVSRCEMLFYQPFWREMEPSGEGREEWEYVVPPDELWPGRLWRLRFRATDPGGASGFLPGPVVGDLADRPDAATADPIRPADPEAAPAAGGGPPAFSWEPGPGATGAAIHRVHLARVEIRSTGYERISPRAVPAGAATRLDPADSLSLRRWWEALPPGAEAFWWVEAREGALRAFSEVRTLRKPGAEAVR